jgi:starch-binding outer membrane protein, SusD/RagB family
MTMSFKSFGATVRASACAALLALPFVGCHGLLDVTDTSRLLASNVEKPAQVDALMNGMEADFVCAYGAFVVTTADISDEFEDTNASGDVWSLDRRRPQAQDNWTGNDCTATMPGPYVPISRVRWVADNMVKLLDGWTDAEVSNRQERMARANLVSGFSVYMLGAIMCSATLDVGNEMSTADLFAAAESRVSNAIDLAQQTGSDDILNAARVGRARVRLYQGDKQGALADAQAVPEGFEMDIYPSTATDRMYNRVWSENLLSFNYGVAPESRNLQTGGVTDPRTASYDTHDVTGWSPGDVWGQQKYPSGDTPMPIARWAEAQLIIAEIQGGQTAVGIINTLRDRWGLPHFASTDETEIQNMVVAERRRELWLEGFRQYDIRRLNLPLDPPDGAPYMPGIKGGSYGSQMCIPLPTIETFNNPNLRGS